MPFSNSFCPFFEHERGSWRVSGPVVSPDFIQASTKGCALEKINAAVRIIRSLGSVHKVWTFRMHFLNKRLSKYRVLRYNTATLVIYPGVGVVKSSSNKIIGR